MASSKFTYNIELNKIVEDKKKEWTDNLKDLSPLIRSKEPNDIVDANALALSYRTMVLDEIAYFLSELASENRTLKELKSEKLILYTTGYLPDGTRPKGNLAHHPLIGNSKINKGEREVVISGDLADFEHTVDILQNTIEFLRESIKTIDSVLYSIKNRLELMNLLRS